MASAPGALLLAPGAGSSSTHSSLIAIEAAVAPLPVARMDFPYRIAGRKAPDRPPILLAAVRQEAELLVARAGCAPDALVLGGRSMGGRICSMTVAEGLPAMGLVLVSYPLHPPGRPDRLRIEHLPHLAVPVLFIHGTKDAFGTRAELESHARVIPGPVTHVWCEGKGHDLKGCDSLIAETVEQFLASLTGSRQQD